MDPDAIPESDNRDLVMDIPLHANEEGSYFISLLGNIDLNGATLIVTEWFKEMMSTLERAIAGEVVTASDRRGMVITGPKGTGKSTSFLYLHAKLKEKGIPLLVLSPSFNSEYFLTYLKSFFEGNTTPKPASEGKDTKEILRNIITSSCQATKRFLFVEVGSITKNALKDIVALLAIVDHAMYKGWYIILSVSSGCGWTNVKESTESVDMTRYMWKFKTLLIPFTSKIFTPQEVNAYMNLHNIDSSKWESDLSRVTNGNPLLLSYFQDTCGNNKKFLFGLQCIQEFLLHLSHDLVESMKSQVFAATMHECHEWLLFAEQETSIPIGRKTNYESSYVARERLTYVVKEDDSTFFIKQNFPMFYEFLMKELRSRFETGEHAFRSSPIVQGMVFETKFLQSGQLNDLHVNAINRDGSKKFYFPMFPNAWLQEDRAVMKLPKGQLYHLRQGHPAIDAVCVANDEDGDAYLVLMQVSLSKYGYGEHKAKASAIFKHTVAKEKVVKPNMSIVEYYLSMTEGIAPDHVLFVYASPKELNAPEKCTFLDVLLDRETRSSSPFPPYFYGFVEEGTNVARTLQRVEGIVRSL